MAELQAKQALLEGVRDAKGQAALAPQLQDAINAAANVAAAGVDGHATADAAKDASGQAPFLSLERFKPCLQPGLHWWLLGFEQECCPASQKNAEPTQ